MGEARQSRWLFGPVPDLFLGCGLGYAIVFVLLWAEGPRIAQVLPLGLLPLLLLVTGTPHYGATLLRVYEERESRRRYAFFTVWVSLALAAAFVASLHWYVLGSILLTLYFNWNPWHYGGQNYGLALMFLHRRGVAVDATTKRLVYGCFLLSALLAIVEMNGAARGALYAPVEVGDSAKVIGPAFRFVPLGIPREAQRVLMAGGLLVYLGCIAAAFLRLKRGARWRDLGPSALLVATQSLWFVVPAAVRLWGAGRGVFPLANQHYLYAFMWVAVGHAVQYLWVTSYYAKREGRLGRGSTYFAKCVLAGAALWHVPALLFAPGVFGDVAYSDGLRLLIAAVVNLHHFVLDGAIWKLRDGSVASKLLRSPSPGAPEPIEVRARLGWRRPAVWAAGTLGLGLAVLGTWEREVGVRQAAERGDVIRLQRAARRLAWIGQDEAALHRTLGEIELQRGRVDLAIREFDKSLAIKRHPRVYFQKGSLYARQREWGAAAEAFEAAYEIDPVPVKLVSHLTRALVQAGRTERAEEVLREALHRHPEDPTLVALQEQLLAFQN